MLRYIAEYSQVRCGLQLTEANININIKYLSIHNQCNQRSYVGLFSGKMLFCTDEYDRRRQTSLSIDQ